MKHLLLIAVITAISSVLAVDCSVWEKYFDKNDTTPFRKVFSDILKAFNTNKLSEVGVILRSEAPNNVRAQYLLGCYYIIQQQDQEGFLWLNKAAKQNYLPAKLYLLQLYAWKQSSPTFLKKVLKLSQELEKSKPMESALYLGIAYYRHKQYKEALQAFHKAANLGSSDALRNMATMYFRGKGVKKNLHEWEKYLKKAAALNNIEACWDLSQYYLKSDKNNSKIVLALFYLKKSAKLGFGPANLTLAEYYLKGKYVKKDFMEAIKYCKKASDKGFFQADFMLAKIYRNGLGVKTDIKMAFKYFVDAGAYLPIAEAMAVELLLKNPSLIDDKKTLSRLLLRLKLKMSKNKGKPWEFVSIGMLLFEGRGLLQNKAKSMEFFRRACKEYDPYIYNTVAYFLAERNSAIPFAKQLMEDVLSREQPTYYYIDTFGYILYKQGKYLEAIEQFKKAIKLKQYSDAYDHLGNAYLKNDNKEKARKAWLTALKLIKDEKLKASIKNKLAKLK